MRELFASIKDAKAWLSILLAGLIGSILGSVVDGATSTVSQVFFLNQMPVDLTRTIQGLEGAASEEEAMQFAQTMFSDALSGLSWWTMAGVLLVSFLSSLLVTSYMEPVKLYLAKGSIEKQPFDLNRILQAAWKKYGTFLLVRGIMGVFLLSVTTGIVFVAFSESETNWLLLVGLVFVLAIGAIVGMFWYQALIYDDLSIGAAFRASLRTSFRGTFEGIGGALFLLGVNVLMLVPTLFLLRTGEFTNMLFGVILFVLLGGLFVAVLIPVSYIWVMRLYAKSRGTGQE